MQRQKSETALTTGRNQAMSKSIDKNSPSIFQIVLLAAVPASTGWSIDLCLPALPFIAESLDAGMGQVQQTLSVFILGVAFGQLIYGPLSDRFGRKPVLVSGQPAAAIPPPTHIATTTYFDPRRFPSRKG